MTLHSREKKNDDDKPAQKEPPAFVVKVTGSGHPMILIPGWTCGGNVWDGTVARFKDRYECHVVTLAGFAGQPAIGDPFLPRVRDALIQYIRDKKFQRPVIVGHSLGGHLALWLGIAAPDLVGPIIAVDAVPFFPALRILLATVETSKPLGEQMRNQMMDQTPEQFAQSNRAFMAEEITDPEDVDRVVEMSSKSDLQAVAQAAYEMMVIDLRDQVKAIQTPVLVIGATSFIEPSKLREIAERLYQLQIEAVPKHKLVFAPKAKHFIQLDEPEFFFQEVETFLKEMDVQKDK